MARWKVWDVRLDILLRRPDGLGDSCVGEATSGSGGYPWITPGWSVISENYLNHEMDTGQKRIAEALILSTPRSIDISGTAYALTCCPGRSLSDEIRICMASVGPFYIITHYIPSCPLLYHQICAHRLDDGTLSRVIVNDRISS